jgi:hypothetical protein
MEKWRRENPEKLREAYRRADLKRKYGITLEDYFEMLSEQGGTCACCDATEADTRGYILHVDHCHETGRVRGLLCASCNNILGRVNDSPAHLRLLADYLERGPNFTHSSIANPAIFPDPV